MPNMSDAIFLDVDKNTPNLAKLDVLLGGVGRIVITEGVEQVANFDEDTGSLYCYSPALPTSELEEFASKHMSLYEEINDLHGTVLSEGENVHIFPFWDQEQLWASHKLISPQPYLLKQMIYDVKCLLDNRDLGTILVACENKHIFLKIQQRCTFGDSTIPLHMAPFCLHIKCNPKSYDVEIVWQAKEPPKTFKIHPLAMPFHFEGYKDINSGFRINTAKNRNELHTQLTVLLDGYELIGIIDSE